MVLLKLVVLRVHKIVGYLPVDRFPDDNDTCTDKGRQVHPKVVLGKVSVTILPQVCQIPFSDEKLCDDDQSHEEQRNREGQEPLSHELIGNGDFLDRFASLIHILNRYELWSLLLFNLHVIGEPFFFDDSLSSFPALKVYDHPDGDEYGVKSIERTIEGLPWLKDTAIILGEIVPLNDKQHQSEYGREDQLSRVVDQPSKVEAKLFSIVVSNKVYRLHIVPKASKKHAKGQLQAILVP